MDRIAKVFGLLLILTLYSCADSVGVFDLSPSVRSERELDRYEFALLARESWVVEYFPDDDQAYGGWIYVMNFMENNRVKMWFEGSSFIGENPVTESEWVVEQGTGPMLKFRTHNDYLHWFTFAGGPNGSDYNAFEGDFEFKIMSVSDSYDEILLRGNRSGNMIRMYPLPQKYTPESFVEIVRNDQTSFTGMSMDLIVNGVKIGKFSRENTMISTSFEKYASSKVWTVSYEYIDADGQTVQVKDKVSSINLPGKVMKFYVPYEFKADVIPYLKGQTMQTFKWELGLMSPLDSYVCTDSFMEIKIK